MRSPRCSKNRAKPSGRRRNSSSCAPTKPRRRGGIGGVAPQVSTRFVTQGHWPRCANCGPPAIRSPAAAISLLAASCPTRRSSTPPPPTLTPSRSSPSCPYSVGRDSAAAHRCGWTRWPAPAPPTIRRSLRSRRPGHRLRRDGRGASQRRPPGSRRPVPVLPNCRNGFRCPRRISSPPMSCAGCAGTGSRSRTRALPSTSFCVTRRCGRGSANSSGRC